MAIPAKHNSSSYKRKSGLQFKAFIVNSKHNQVKQFLRKNEKIINIFISLIYIQLIYEYLLYNIHLQMIKNICRSSSKGVYSRRED